MEANWLNDFMRVTLLNRTRALDIVGWCRALIETLREHKPDHELHIFGVNRVAGLPNYFLASSGESRLKDKPIQITVTKKTADLFLHPDTGGLRILQEELPMTVIYQLPEVSKKLDIPFYDAICIDTDRHSLVIGLIVTDCPVQEFLPMDELLQLMPLVRNHAMPLLELQTLADVKIKMEEDMDSMLNLMRQSNPEISKADFNRAASFVEKSTEDRQWEPAFLHYVVQELRSPLGRLIAMNDKLLELSRTSLGSPQVAELAQAVREGASLLEEEVRTLGNVAMLSQGDVQPRPGAFPMQALIREVYPLAVEIAGRYRVQIKLEEFTRNIFLSGDQKTLVRMIERWLRFVMPLCANGTLIIRTTDDPDRVERGFAAMEFEDSGEFPEDVPLATMLQPQQMLQARNSRLRRGGGILLSLLSLYIEKAGGKLALVRGEKGGFAVRLVIPQVSRAEREKIMAGEVAP